jgi:pimeloyl-ACP methyl ester carboxylesterase
VNKVQRFGLIYYLIAILAIGWSHKILAQDDNQQIPKSDVELREYMVGFQLLEEQDYSRMVTGGVSSSKAHPRPMRIYLWYPAKNIDNAQAMYFGDYATLADEDIWPADISGNLRDKFKYFHRPLIRSLDQEHLEALLQQPVIAIANAEALEGPFPLVVIGQGLYYESPVAFAAMSEYLAGHGFVVATCPLVGTNSPIVKLDVEDLETQVRDLEFAIAQVRRLSFVSQDKLGVFGFDMGGMAGLILTMRNADVDAFVSVSSGILSTHPSNLPVRSPHYDTLALRIPWLHSLPTWWLSLGYDSIPGSLFENAIHSERYLLLTEGMGHVDYTSYALIEGRSEMMGYWASANPEAPEKHKAVLRYISNFFTAFLEQDPESRLFLTQDPKKSISDSTMTLEHRPAAPTSINYEEFVLAVLAGQGDEAIDEVRALRATHPDHILLNEEYLRRLVVSLRHTWGLIEETMPVIMFMAELYPLSENAQWWLAQGYMDAGDYSAAAEIYSNLLKKYPDNDWLRSRLEWLRNQ